MPGDERRTAAGGGLGGHHAEGLGKDRRHDRGVGERQEMDEMPVLERPGEEHPVARKRRGEPLELGPVVAEADDHRARVERGERLEQELDALVLDQLAEVDDRRPVAGEERREPLGVALVGQPLVRRSRVRRILPRLVEEVGQRLVAVLPDELVDVDARRHLDHPVDVTRDLLQHLADVPRADEDRLGRRERLAAPALEPRPPAHRVLELRAVRLDPEAHAARRTDRGAHQHVVRETRSAGSSARSAAAFAST